MEKKKKRLSEVADNDIKIELELLGHQVKNSEEVSDDHRSTVREHWRKELLRVGRCSNFCIDYPSHSPKTTPWG